MMHSRFASMIGMSALALALGAAGCGGGGGTAGSGGTTGGSGGTSSSGGHVGSGGSTGSGGATGSGGHVGSGGASSGGASASGGATGSGGHVGSGGAGTASGGATATGGAGTASGGATGTGGATGGTGMATGGSGPGGATGTGGAAGGGTGSGAWQCPPASTFSGMTPFSGSTMAATRIANAPPADSFNNMGNDFTNVEGPVWIGDALYYSEMTGANLPPARILKMTADDISSVFIDMSGSNGLATDGTDIFSANHGAQGIVKFSVADKTPTTLVSMFNGKKFNCPNDLTVASDGTIYFTDPDYQNSGKPQGTTSVYQVKNGTATLITDYTMEPNGISLSLDEQTLLIGGHQGLKKYPITNGTVAMTGTAFGPSDVTASGVNTDGMTLDCAGNVYVAVASTTNVIVVKADGTKLGTITISGAQAVTNVAFGGTDHQTLYLTGQGSGKNQGVFKIHLNIPGLPY